MCQLCLLARSGSLLAGTSDLQSVTLWRSVVGPDGGLCGMCWNLVRMAGQPNLVSSFNCGSVECGIWGVDIFSAGGRGVVLIGGLEMNIS